MFYSLRCNRHLCLLSRVELEAGVGFGFQKPGFSRKCWLPGQLQLPSIQKLLASASASASLNAVFDGFGFGFVIFFTAEFGFGFGFPELCALLSLFNSRFDKAFIHKLRFASVYLQATLFPSIRSSRNLCLFSSRLETLAAADAANSSARHRRIGAVGLQLCMPLFTAARC